jgi:hypothetical protein
MKHRQMKSANDIIVPDAEEGMKRFAEAGKHLFSTLKVPGGGKRTGQRKPPRSKKH